MSDYLIQQYISSSGEWIPLGGEGASALEAQAAEIRSLREEVEALRLLVTRGD